MFASDTTDVLAFQRVAGNAHELDELHAELRKIQARLSATEDDDELDVLVAQRKAMKARIEGFVIVADSFDYAPTGQTVAEMWNAGDDAVKRGMVRAVKASWGLGLVAHDGRWGVAVGTVGAAGGEGVDGVVDLGNGPVLPPVARSGRGSFGRPPGESLRVAAGRPVRAVVLRHDEDHLARFDVSNLIRG